MGKVVKTALLTIAVGAVVGLTGGLLAPAAVGTVFGFTGAAAGAIAGAITSTVSVGLGLIAQQFAKKPSQNMDAALSRLTAYPNPNALGAWIFGETISPLNVMYEEQLSNGKLIAQIFATAAHRITSYGNLHINTDAISFSGAAATGDYADTLWRVTKLGADGDAAITNIGGTAISFPTTAKGRGLAKFALLWKLGKDKTQNGIPSRITQVVKGAPVYDPRLDSTRGGSGTHRADDQSTWEYTHGGVDIGANWALVVAFYLLGWHTEDGNNKLVFGVGKDPDDIDWDSVIDAANVCDETVDSKPRYRVGGIFPTDNDHENIIPQLEAANGGKVAKVGGRYFLWAPHDDLTAFSSISENDLVREAGVNFVPSGPLENLYNIGRGRYIEPDQLYQAVPYPEVRESTAVTEDGRERVEEHDFALVQDVEIAQRVERQKVRRSRFTGTWRFAQGPRGLLFRPFSVTNLNCIETDNADQIVRAIEMQFSVTGAVAMQVMEEDSSIYDTSDALGTAVTQMDPASFDPADKVAVSGLTVSTVSFTGSGGTATDGFQVSWSDPGSLVRESEIQFKKHADTDWITVAPTQVDLLKGYIFPVEPGTDYDVRVRHTTIFGTKPAWSDATNVATSSANTSGSTQKTQSAGAADSAPWSGVSNDDGNRPEDGATKVLALTGNKITSGSVNTDAIVTDAIAQGTISNVPSALTTTTTTVNTSWTTFQSINHTITDANEKAIVKASLRSFDTSTATFSIRIRRAGTVLKTISGLNGGNSGNSILQGIKKIDAPGVGTYTYDVQAQISSGTQALADRYMEITSLKKSD